MSLFFSGTNTRVTEEGHGLCTEGLHTQEWLVNSTRCARNHMTELCQEQARQLRVRASRGLKPKETLLV